MVLFQADLEASGYSVSSKVKNKCKRKNLLKAVTVNTF